VRASCHPSEERSVAGIHQLLEQAEQVAFMLGRLRELADDPHAPTYAAVRAQAELDSDAWRDAAARLNAINTILAELEAAGVRQEQLEDHGIEWARGLTGDQARMLMDVHVRGAGAVGDPLDQALTMPLPAMRVWRAVSGTVESVFGVEGRGRAAPAAASCSARKSICFPYFAHAEDGQALLLEIEVPTGQRGAYLPLLSEAPTLDDGDREWLDEEGVLFNQEVVLPSDIELVLIDYEDTDWGQVARCRIAR